eukprot:COSAG05_NODE_7531_length_800_cov_1.025678_1_plen_106_part_10
MACGLQCYNVVSAFVNHPDASCHLYGKIGEGSGMVKTLGLVCTFVAVLWSVSDCIGNSPSLAPCALHHKKTNCKLSCVTKSTAVLAGHPLGLKHLLRGESCAGERG